MRSPPAFQCYASDLLADERFRLMTTGERGLFMSMKLQCWVSDSVPAEPRELARVLGLPLAELQSSLTPTVFAMFEKQPDGRLTRQELVDQKRALIERRAQQGISGKKGAKKRWDKNLRRMATPMGTPSGIATRAPEKRRADMSGQEERDFRKGIAGVARLIDDPKEIEDMRRAFGEIP